MARSRDSKKKVLESIKNQLEESSAVFFVSLQGLTVKEASELRKNCRANNISCLMAKKTLFRKVFNEAKVEGIDFKKLQGEVAAAFSFTDEVSPAKIFAKFKKDHDKFQILGGVVLSGPHGAQLLNAMDITQLSRLPSREELLGNLVGTLANPLRGMVGVLQGPIRGLITVMNGIAQKS